MKKYYFILFFYFAGLILSAINPRNYWHWIGETAPTIIGMIILVATFRKFRFSIFTYIFILSACFLMFIGAHYTFSRVPVFNWLKEITGSDRNNFDKFGHFIQGIVPVLIAREWFIRKKTVNGQGWISFLSFCVAMGVASVYEIIEYIVCMLAKKNPETFLGTQGFYWDSQTDMLFAMLGAVFTIFVLAPLHSRAMKKNPEFI